MNDNYKLMMGIDLAITPQITLVHPKVRTIFEYGEDTYFAQIASFVATPSDLKVELDDVGLNFEEMTEWQLFLMRTNTFKNSVVEELVKGIDFGNAQVLMGDTGELILYDPISATHLDEAQYRILCEYIRTIHGLKRNVEVYGNEFTRKMVLEIERDTRRHKAYQASEPFLYNYVSALINCSESKYDYHTIWDVPFYVFMDAVRRVQKVIEFKGLMSGMYSGMVDVEKIDMNKMSWIGKLD